MFDVIPDLFTKKLADQHIVVVGGSSGMGKATAQLASALGASVTIASRNRGKLEAAAAAIGNKVSTAQVDMTDEPMVKSWAQTLRPVDHLVISASSAAHGKFSELPTSALREMFDAKFFGPYIIAREVLPKLKPQGSVTLFSGVLSRRPGLAASGLGAVNSAVEGLVRGLALELGKSTRVNAISPGMVRTEAYAEMTPAAQQAMFDSTASSLPVGNVGDPMDIAQAVIMAATNPYLNGAVIDVDGGHMVRQ